jgi:mannose-6-phosphate isomerase
MKLKPVLKDIVWGGTRLADEYKKAEPNTKIAESWELCAHPNGVNIIENGEYAGKTLEEIYNYDSAKFPILIKFIDAEQDLSVQVHPDNDYAEKHAGESGKTEMWYIMDCKPGAQLVYGLNADYTREQLEESINSSNSGKFENCLNYVNVKPGDVFFIPAGLIHAIGAGILLAEIQQNSDTTYRLYDYNRPGADGKPRELHVKQALDVCIKTKSEYKNPKIKNESAPWIELLSEFEYFSVSRLNLKKIKKSDMNISGYFASVICLDGDGEIIAGREKYKIKKGDSYFIPAGIDSIQLAGGLDLIITTSTTSTTSRKSRK